LRFVCAEVGHRKESATRTHSTHLERIFDEAPWGSVEFIGGEGSNFWPATRLRKFIVGKGCL
jgi:hypothetical protein